MKKVYIVNEIDTTGYTSGTVGVYKSHRKAVAAMMDYVHEILKENNYKLDYKYFDKDPETDYDCSVVVYREGFDANDPVDLENCLLSVYITEHKLR